METGLQHEECVCGARRGENTVIAKLDHVHTGISHHEAVAANCITEGSLEYWTCSSEKCKGKYYGDANCQTVIENVTIPVNPENHVGTGKWDKDADKHVYTCSCGKVLIEGKHQYSDDTDSDCNECGYKRFYLVTGGANAAYERGTEAGLTITADGDVKLLKAVEVDRKIIDESNYEVKAGSTIITLKKSYLDTLSAVTHDIRILYTDGKAATTQFTIKETNVNGNGNTNGAQNGQTANESNAAETQNGHISPQTGEENHSVLWIALAMSAVSAIMVFSWYRWKKLRK